MLADDLIEQLRLLTTLILAWREGKGVEKDQIEQGVTDHVHALDG